MLSTLVGRPVSIIGESPVTVTVSASVPICICTSIGERDAGTHDDAFAAVG